MNIHTLPIRLSHGACALLAFTLLATVAAPPLMGQNTPRYSFKQNTVQRRQAFQGSKKPVDARAVGEALLQWEQSNAVLERHPALRAARGANTAQILAYDALAAGNPDLKVFWNEHGSMPIFISGRALARGGADLRESTLQETANRFFLDCSGLLRQNVASSFHLSRIIREENGVTHARFAQSYEGVPIWGSEAVLQFDARGNVILFSGRIIPAPVCSITPGIDDVQALSAAKAVLGLQNPPSINGRAELVIYAKDADAQARLAYLVRFAPTFTSRWIVILDAVDGSPLLKYNAICADGPEKATATDLNGQQRSIDVYLQQGLYYMIDASRPMYKSGESSIPDNPVGAIVTVDATNTDLTQVEYVSSATNAWSDAAAVSAHANAGITYEYFRNTHAHDGIDGAGTTVISVVNVTDGNIPMENAYWNGRFMIYGNGGASFKPFAGALDVAAHEMTHGVTEYTAQLLYLNQSGALNEAFSDMFAAMVDRDDWKIGEDIVRPGSDFPSGALRDLSDPHNGATSGSPAWQPKHMSEFVNVPESQDNGGVHINSGIPNHAAYLLATAIGRDKTEKILFRALATKLAMQSRFVDFRLAIIRSAEELFGSGSPEASACAAACTQVGIDDGSGTGRPPDLPAVNGADNMLFVSTDVTDPVFLWSVKPPANPGDYTSISQSPVFTRPSVSDDGSMAVFVDVDGNIRAVSLVQGIPNEQLIDTSGIWSSIAISRDKRLVALTTMLSEPTIYIIDIGGSVIDLRMFTVYCPTYSDDILPDVAQYADAMDFSTDNSSLIFDSYNSMQIDNDDVGFWEINLMSVWNPTSASFSSGNIFRLYPQAPNIHLANPTFARNKPGVITFDMKNSEDQTGFIVASDLYTKVSKPLAATAFVESGFPAYRGDDAVVSFASSSLSSTGADSIYNVPLASDAITPTGPPRGFIPSGMFPIWYRQGTRPTSTDRPEREIPEAFVVLDNYPNPFNPATTITMRLARPMRARVTIHDAMGREIRTLRDGFMDAGAHSIIWNGTDAAQRACGSGVYTVRVTTAQGTSSRSMLMLK